MRDPARATGLAEGIERAVGNLDDPDSVAKAVHGVEAIFLLQVGGGTEQTQTMIGAACNEGVPKIVLNSSIGARLMPLEVNPDRDDRGDHVQREWSWRMLAACRSVDPDLFFPVSSAGKSLEQADKAKAVCACCLVRRQCLAFSLRTRQAHGIWGGLTEE